jgi:hypothetical protein
VMFAVMDWISDSRAIRAKAMHLDQDEVDSGV